MAGGRRANKAAGIRVAQTSSAITASAARQSICVMSQAANGDIVMGATPTPTDTSATARPRRSLIQPITEQDLESLVWKGFAKRRLAKAWEGEDDSLYDYL